NTGWLSRLDLRPAQHRSLLHKGRPRDFLVSVGALDAPAISMGSADAARLAFLFRNCTGEHFCWRRPNRIAGKIIDRIPNGGTRRKSESRSPKRWSPAQTVG